MTVRNIALDPGFGGFKAAEVQGNAVKVVTVPSVVGTRSSELGLLDPAGVTGRRRHADQPYHLAFGGADFLTLDLRTCDLGFYTDSVIIEAAERRMAEVLGREK